MRRRSRDHFLDAIVRLPYEFALCVYHSGTVLADRARLAGDSASRRRGLLGRESLAAGEALVIAPSQGVHTFGMRIPLDLVFVGRSGHVLKIVRAVPPGRVRLAWRAFAVIELAAGRCDEIGLALDDRLVALPT